MNISHYVRGGIAALSFSIASVLPSIAQPAITYSSSEKIQDHLELLTALEDMGVNIQINNPQICAQEEGTAGFWVGGHKLLALCQQVIRRSDNPVWTGEIFMASDDDLDTIRHEAHHVIQDCMDGDIDGQLVTYLDEENSKEFLSYYPEWKQQYVIEQYREVGANQDMIDLEVEAWAVADMVTADMIKEVVVRECEGL